MDNFYASFATNEKRKVADINRYFRHARHSGEAHKQESAHLFQGAKYWMSLLCLAIVFVFAGGLSQVKAQDPRGIDFNLPLNDNNLTNNGNSISLYGASTLTSGNKDQLNKGWLRLTPCTPEENGYALFSKSFSPPIGVLVEFDYKMWRDQAGKSNFPLGNGMSVFLYDGGVANADFKIAAAGYGAPLGYAKCPACKDAAAVTKGYLGIGLDVYGAFSNPAFLGDGPENRPNSIAIRGDAISNTLYKTGTTSNLNDASASELHGIALGNDYISTDRPDTPRRIRFFLTPGTRIGNYVDMNITVQMQIQVGGPFYSVVKNVPLNQSVYVNPDNPNDVNNKTFKVGFAASTGWAVAYHEIRNLIVSTPMNLITNNTVVGANPDLPVGDKINYQTTITNAGSTGIGNYPATFSIVTTGVDIPLDLTKAANAVITRNALAKDAVIEFSAISSTSGNQVYLVKNFPAGAALTLIYSGTISSTATSAINNARIVPPTGFGNIDSNDGRGVVQTFIKPVMASLAAMSICPDTSLGLSFSATPTAFTQFTWTSTVRPNVMSPAQPNIVINDRYSNTTLSDIGLSYTVVPQITAVIVNSDGSSKPDVTRTTTGVSKTFPLSVTHAIGGGGPVTINVAMSNDGTNVRLTASSNVPDAIYTWYRDANSPRVVLGNGVLVVPSSQVSGTKYPYYVTVSSPIACESKMVASTIDVPVMVSISQASVPKTVAAHMTASLPQGVIATKAISVEITPGPSFPGVGYIVNGQTVGRFTVVIPANENAVSFTIHTIDDGLAGDRVFSLGGTATDGTSKVYGVAAGTLTVTDLPIADDSKVYISSSTILGGRVATIQASLLRVNASPVTVLVSADSPGFPAGYSVNGVNTFSIVIKAGELYATSEIRTTVEANTRIFTLRGYASDGSSKQYAVTAGDLTVLGSNVDPNKVITINSRRIPEGTAIDMTASVPVASGSAFDVMVVPSPAFPANYKVKVNGTYVSNINGFNLRFESNKTSAVFTVETADDGIAANRSFLLNGAATGISGYNVVSGNLTVLDKSVARLIEIDLTNSSVINCSGASVAINGFIQRIRPVHTPDNYLRYYRYSGGLMIPINNTTTVNQAGVYTIYAINPETGDAGSTALTVVNSPAPAFSLVSSITYYTPIAVDLTDPLLITNSSDVKHYNYYSDSAGNNPVINPSSVTTPGTYYIQGVSEAGCLSTLHPITVISGGAVHVQMTANVSTLDEGDSGYFRLKLFDSNNNPVRLQKKQIFNFTLNTEAGNTLTPGHAKVDGKLTFPMVVELDANNDYKDLSVEALKDNILFNTELLVLTGKNDALGSTTANMKVIDKTSTVPGSQIITIGNGSIYSSGSISISASLPTGFTSAQPITVLLSIGAGSNLDGLPAPSFPSSVVIPANSNSVEFLVTASNTSDDTATLILSGTTNGFKVNSGTILIFNTPIKAIMSVSANGDMINDFSEIMNIEKFLDNEVVIIDRWGVLVWQGKGYNNRDIAFTGKCNQKRMYDLPSGIYFYVIRFYDDEGKLNIYKGSMKLKQCSS